LIAEAEAQGQGNGSRCGVACEGGAGALADALKTIVLPQRDERRCGAASLACNAVFDARRGSRKEAEERKQGQRRTFEVLCERLEQLAQSTEVDEGQVRQSQRELQDQWRRAFTESGPVPAALEARFKAARSGVEELLRGRTRRSEAAAWEALFAKQRLCEEVDAPPSRSDC
jgi:hypothetical protein